MTNAGASAILSLLTFFIQPLLAPHPVLTLPLAICWFASPFIFLFEKHLGYLSESFSACSGTTVVVVVLLYSRGPPFDWLFAGVSKKKKKVLYRKEKKQLSVALRSTHKALLTFLSVSTDWLLLIFYFRLPWCDFKYLNFWNALSSLFPESRKLVSSSLLFFMVMFNLRSLLNAYCMWWCLNVAQSTFSRL